LSYHFGFDIFPVDCALKGKENMQELKRCDWVGLGKPYYDKYHDEEWGVPVYDDQKLFEMLILEGAQAGLSWETILRKRDGYRTAFKDFNVRAVASMTDQELENLLLFPHIIRNRLKIFSTRINAQVFLKIQKEFGSFSNYLWDFVNNRPITNAFRNIGELQIKSAESDKISYDLKKRGMKFVGSTIIYAYMQAVGLVNDHLTCCWKYEKQ